jgi:hypothetical protein
MARITNPDVPADIAPYLDGLAVYVKGTNRRKPITLPFTP